MAFYVPIGARGAIFRFGTLLIGILGSMAYRRAHRRRRISGRRAETGKARS